MTGLELYSRLVESGIRIPTIIITGHDEGDYREKCMAAGVLAYLRKPLGREGFMSAVDSAISGRTLLR